MARKGLLEKEQEQFLVDALLFWFKMKNGIVKTIVGKVLLWVVRFADNKGAERIPEAWKSDLIPIIDAAISEQFEKTRLLIVDLLNKRIDIKPLDDEQELMVFDAFTKFLATAIDYYIQKKNKG